MRWMWKRLTSIRLMKWSRKLIPEIVWWKTKWVVCNFYRGRWWWSWPSNDSWWGTSVARGLNRDKIIQIWPSGSEHRGFENSTGRRVVDLLNMIYLRIWEIIVELIATFSNCHWTESLQFPVAYSASLWSERVSPKSIKQMNNSISHSMTHSRDASFRLFHWQKTTSHYKHEQLILP